MAQDYNVTLSATSTVQLPVMTAAAADHASISTRTPSTEHGGNDEGPDRRAVRPLAGGPPGTGSFQN